MKKYQVVKESMRFDEIIKSGCFKKNKYFIIYNKESNFNYPRFGIAVGKKVGSAVIRNKIKRQIRIILTNNQNLFKKNQDYIIMVKVNVLNASYQEMEKDIINIIEKG